MKTSIIIPVYNQLPEVLKVVQSVSMYTQDCEIILVDDCSTEFNLSQLFGPPLRVIRNQENYGFARTCNIGASQAQGDVLVFLNSDIQASQGWLEPILRLFEKPEVGIVGPKLIFPPQADNKLLIQSCGGGFDGLKNPYHLYIGWAFDDWRVNQEGKVSWTTGAAIAIRRDDFVKCGGFDEGYIRAYWEDVDLCMKVRFNLGKEIWYTPYSTLMHTVGKSTVTLDPSKGWANAEAFKYNKFLFHQKWDDRIIPETNQIMVPF